ncbi:MAG: iron-sulfur cluster assembly scaffold protein [Candidatus Acidifodinimicrobium sp.]
MDEMRFYELSEIYKNPPHFKKIENATYSYEGFSPSCGDNFTVYLKVNGKKIEDASFFGYGCVVSTISLSKLCDYIIGKDIDILNEIDLAKIEDLVGIDQINPGRIKCATLGIDSFKKAVTNKKEQKS